MSDVIEATVFVTAVLALGTCALMFYLISILARIETMLCRLTRERRPPQAKRDGNGRPLYERE